MRFRTIVLAAALLAFGGLARAQEPALVSGVLTTTEGRGPIGGATVRLVENGSSTELTLRSDAKGRFSRVGLRPGRYRASIERDGFAAVDVIEIDVRPSDHVRLYVAMTPFDEAPFRRQTIRYRRPLVNVENAAISTRVM